MKTNALLRPASLRGTLSLALSMALMWAGSSTLVLGQGKIPKAKRWIRQVENQLMPYWMTPEAIGSPPGNFPCYRSDEGTGLVYDRFDFSSIPPYLAPFLCGQTDSLRRHYYRINSRQVYTYCVAYHLTGREEYLRLARAGLNYLLLNGGYAEASPYTFSQDGKDYPAFGQQTAQDLAYAMLAPAMYYYLTRDPVVMGHIIRLQQKFMTDYFARSDLSARSKIMRWVLEDYDGESHKGRKLLAPLDHLNAYMTLLAPIVPDSLRASWTEDLRALSSSLRDNFYDPALNMFWGDLDDRRIGAGDVPTDFGHSIKSFWMLYLAGHLLGDEPMWQFADRNGRRLLHTAFVEDAGEWCGNYQDSTLARTRDINWWTHAELDQMCATLSLSDPTLYDRYLRHSFAFWEKSIIDPTHGETHTLIHLDDGPIPIGMKAFHWKNGFHSLEHALVGYIATAARQGEPATLYFAPESTFRGDDFQPYYFSGYVRSSRPGAFSDPTLSGLQKLRVVYDKIGAPGKLRGSD